MSEEIIWNNIMTDEEWKEAVRKHALGMNPAVAIKALQWIGEGKGHVAGITGGAIRKIIFEGLEDDNEQIQGMDSE